YWRLSKDLQDIPRLQHDLAAIEGDLNLLRTNLQALTVEARRQVGWAEVLAALSQHIPATMRLEAVGAGGAPLLETAPFMAGLRRAPAVNKRFQLKSWKTKPPAGSGPASDEGLLSI